MIDLRQSKAFAFTFALIFLALIISFMTVYILAVVNGVWEANRLDASKKAYYVAEAGLADAYERIESLVPPNVFASSTCGNYNEPSTCTCPFIPSPTANCPSPSNPTTDNGVYSVGSVNGSYIVSLQYYSAYPRTGYIITSQGTYGNFTKTLQLNIMAASFSKYAYWSQTEINPTLGALYWISGMSTSGPVQTNGQFNIIGNPVFNGPTAEANYTENSKDVWGVWTDSPNYVDGTGNNPNSSTTSDPNAIFTDGLTNQAPQVSLPPPTTVGDFLPSATDGGLVLTGASTITFNSTGTLTVTGDVVNSSCKTTTAYNKTTINAPSSGVIYIQNSSDIAACKYNGSANGNATVSGTVDGALTVAAENNIYISGNVQYEDEPPRPAPWPSGGDPNSPDMLGLVAEENVTVIEADAPAQLEIDGVVAALGGSFDVDQYSKNPDPIAGGLDGAVMSQFGGLINYATGCTGIVNGNGQLIDGWNQIQGYDTRLLKYAPPGFPVMLNASGLVIYTKLNISECYTGTCG